MRRRWQPDFFNHNSLTLSKCDFELVYSYVSVHPHYICDAIHTVQLFELSVRVQRLWESVSHVHQQAEGYALPQTLMANLKPCVSLESD